MFITAYFVCRICAAVNNHAADAQLGYQLHDSLLNNQLKQPADALVNNKVMSNVIFVVACIIHLHPSGLLATGIVFHLAYYATVSL